MKTIVFNDDNLSEDEVAVTSIKARGILINNEKEILVAKYGGVLLLPGGTLDKGEEIEETLVRELREELGLEILVENRTPDLLIEQLVKNYPRRRNAGFTDRLSSTYYFLIHTNEIFDNMCGELTESENKCNFTTFLVPINNVAEIVTQNAESTINPRDKYFSRELLAVVEETKKLVRR